MVARSWNGTCHSEHVKQCENISLVYLPKRNYRIHRSGFTFVIFAYSLHKKDRKEVDQNAFKASFSLSDRKMGDFFLVPFASSFFFILHFTLSDENSCCFLKSTQSKSMKTKFGLGLFDPTGKEVGSEGKPVGGWLGHSSCLRS